ncbi:MAG: phosphoribosylamine--glycine ligase [Bacillota bacterium]|nr:phosphoribosylamine--glycine ligase [Bacillota bacterium]
MKILVVGGGGREHALVWKISQSPLVDKIYCAPGNGGISDLAECIPVKAMDIEGVVKFSKEKGIDMVMVAPDDPLAAGMVDALENEGIRAFGPRKNAAVIEGSKAFSKELMKKYNIPTAKYATFTNSTEAIEYLSNQNSYPIVVKADGLALGKGVVIAGSFEEARDAVNSMMNDKVFGEAGNCVVIEEFMKGPEVSVLAFTDGKTVVPMVSAQDHKRALDNDQGLNTGGMGAFSPSKIYTPELASICMKTIFKPTIDAMNAENRKFKGVLYFGLMLTDEGPKVLEYNARFGDPETQAVLPRLKTDLIEIFNAVIDEKLSEIKIEWMDKAAVCIILASGGYPQKYQTGYEISGLNEAAKLPDITVFHAGTKKENGKYYTAGGRVLGVTATGATADIAISKAYEAVKSISFEKMHYRRDIGRK